MREEVGCGSPVSSSRPRPRLDRGRDALALVDKPLLLSVIARSHIAPRLGDLVIKSGVEPAISRVDAHALESPQLLLAASGYGAGNPEVGWNERWVGWVEQWVRATSRSSR